jgi:4-amino-4-deoxy-L-arabinose transferase-like glycosyltransferase
MRQTEVPATASDATSELAANQRVGDYMDPGIAARGWTRIDRRNVFLGVLATGLAMLLSWPVAEMAFGDDVAYIHMAFSFARTGHLIYNGWEAAIMVQPAIWGALAVRLFGFSFTAVRLSTVPFALGSVALSYVLARRSGLRPLSCTLVALVSGLNPVFLPEAVSFMTDVPALFFFLASLYCLVLAHQENQNWRGYFWLFLGVAVGLFGGTGRQSVWFVPLVVLPYLGWSRRQNFRLAAAAVAGWAVTLVFVSRVTAWFNRQLYVVPQDSLVKEWKLALTHAKPIIDVSARLILMMLFMTLPAALPLVFHSWRETWSGNATRKILVAVLLLATVSAILIHPSLASIPWISNTLNWNGIHGSDSLSGRPLLLTRPIRAVAALSVYLPMCMLLGWLTRISQFTRAWRVVLSPRESEFTFAAMSLVCLTYFAVMVIRSIEFDVFDRYLLPMFPWVAISLLLAMEGVDLRAPLAPRYVMACAWAVLAVLATYGVLSTQDFWSLARARVVGTRSLEAAGVPRTAIDAGMEYNFWTQLQVNGQLNWHWVKNPPGAYRPGLGVTPEVVPVYRLEYAPVPGETVPTEFGAIPYYSLLPPFRKQVSIDRIVKAPPRND